MSPKLYGPRQMAKYDKLQIAKEMSQNKYRNFEKYDPKPTRPKIKTQQNSTSNPKPQQITTK